MIVEPRRVGEQSFFLGRSCTKSPSGLKKLKMLPFAGPFAFATLRAGVLSFTGVAFVAPLLVLLVAVAIPFDGIVGLGTVVTSGRFAPDDDSGGDGGLPTEGLRGVPLEEFKALSRGFRNMSSNRSAWRRACCV